MTEVVAAKDAVDAELKVLEQTIAAHKAALQKAADSGDITADEQAAQMEALDKKKMFGETMHTTMVGILQQLEA